MDQATLRGLLLGPTFSPKVEDIPTPQALLDKGVPDGILRLVSMSAQERFVVFSSFDKDTSMFNSALLIAAALRLRDEGGDDGKGTPVMAPVDAKALIGQDAEIFDALATLVKPFLGIGQIVELVQAEKKDSATGPSSDGGHESPTSSDSAPSVSAGQESAIPTS